MAAYPGLLVQSLSGRTTWTEFEPIVRLVLDDPALGPRYIQVTRLAPTRHQDAPDDEFRAQAARLLGEQSDKLVAFAYVVDGDGFLAAIARAVVTGIGVVTRTRHPQKTFATALAASQWLATQSPTGLEATDIVAALDAVEAERARVHDQT